MDLVLVCCQFFAFTERFGALIALKWMLRISHGYPTEQIPPLYVYICVLSVQKVG